MLAFLKALDPIEWLLIAAITALSIWLAALHMENQAAHVSLSLSQEKLAESQKDLADYKAAAAETARLLQAANDRRALDQLNKVKEAQDAAKIREAKYRADAVAARKQLDGLRIALRKALASGDPVSSPAADASGPAATVGQLFMDCAAAYTDLAGKADQHASDVQTLTEAWAK